METKLRNIVSIYHRKIKNWWYKNAEDKWLTINYSQSGQSGNWSQEIVNQRSTIDR